MLDSSIKKVLVIGSGPIVIGQSAEFDYSGTQACRALREEGIEVVLVNSNPATIQTDRETADIVYIEPLDVNTLERIIKLEKPDSILPTVGGQTALNLAVELSKRGILKENNVRLIGSGIETIERGESRDLFNEAMKKLNIPILKSYSVNNFEDGLKYSKELGFPVIIRPAFTLGGTGGGFANNEEELKKVLSSALKLSKTNEALIEKSIYGWEEYEYEIVRDSKGNSIIICNMENIDPMGVHTGESIVVAPSQTLPDKIHQKFRDAALKIVEELGIKGACNAQFALNKKTNEFVVIEVNPRLSRSSALASKATGYPIARIAAKISLGKTLDKIINPIIGKSAGLEPALDYLVVKIPRWPFDKFSTTSRKIGTQMKSTGEVMAIGRTFEEATLKAINSLEIKFPKKIKIEEHLEKPTDIRLFAILEALRLGRSVDGLFEITKINKWFLRKFENIVKIEKEIGNSKLEREILIKAKRAGFTDKFIAGLSKKSEDEIRKLRKELGVVPTFKIVDSCAGEFEAITPYYYSTYGKENEAKPLEGKKVIIIGAGPIRIGQGIEFDYCCSQASFTLKKLGIKSILINNNPETVSTDFDSSDRLYFEPLNFEKVMDIIDNESNEDLLGVVVQLGGQTSIKLAQKLNLYGVKLLGTSFDGIDLAEDRERFKELMEKIGVKQPESATVRSSAQAVEFAKKIGYPVVVRPSYVIAGRGMQIVFNEQELEKYMSEAIELSEDRPVLIDKYLDNAYECEVDCVSDSTNTIIGGVMEHIEFAGVHSGDANIVVPTLNLPYKVVEKIKKYSREIAKGLGIVGLLNIQFAIKEMEVYILEANPRASRTVPYLSKATDTNLVDLALRAMIGEKVDGKDPKINHFAVKSVVFPFLKLQGGDILLGPEMKSTGETMGLGEDFESAYYKALKASGVFIPKRGGVLLTLKQEDRKEGIEIAKKLTAMGFRVYATPGTAFELRNVTNIIIVNKIGSEGYSVLDAINEKKVDLVINTPRDKTSEDGYKIRLKSIEKNIPCLTNMRTAIEFVYAIEKYKNEEFEIKRFYDYGK